MIRERRGERRSTVQPSVSFWGHHLAGTRIELRIEANFDPNVAKFGDVLALCWLNGWQHWPSREPTAEPTYHEGGLPRGSVCAVRERPQHGEVPVEAEKRG